MTQQCDVECRTTRRIGDKRCRGRGPYAPACLGSTRHRFGIDAQDKRQHPRSCRRHRDPARGGKVEQRSLSPWLDHHGADLAAFDDIGTRAQDRERIGRIDQDELVGIEPKLGKADGVKMPAETRTFILADPDDRMPRSGGAHRDHHRKSGSRAAIVGRGRKHLVQGPVRQTAAEATVDIIDTKRHGLFVDSAACKGRLAHAKGSGMQSANHMFYLCSIRRLG